MRTPGNRIAALDGLRGFAVLLILLVHFVAGPLVGSAVPADKAVCELARLGWAGVDLFFVLSGFLITGILLDTRGQPTWWRNFAIRRVLRIFPLYYGVVLVLLVLPRLLPLPAAGAALLRADQAWYWTYTTNLLRAVHPDRGGAMFTAHFWSLAVEEQFYLVWPLVVWLCPARALRRLALATIVLGLGLRLALVLFSARGPDMAFLLTPARLDGLMAGAALAATARLPGGLTAARALAPRAALLGLLGFAILIAAGPVPLTPLAPAYAVLGYPFLALIFGALLTMALDSPDNSIMMRLCRHRYLRTLGKYSYALYVLHNLLLGMMLRLVPPASLELAAAGHSRLPLTLVFAIAGSGASLALAWLSWHLWEKRFLDLKDRLAPRLQGSR